MRDPLAPGAAAQVVGSAPYAVAEVAKMPRFAMEEFPDRTSDELAELAQEAESLHAEHGRTFAVLALVDEPGFFSKGDTVYESRGAPE